MINLMGAIEHQAHLSCSNSDCFSQFVFQLQHSPLASQQQIHHNQYFHPKKTQKAAHQKLLNKEIARRKKIKQNKLIGVKIWLVSIFYIIRKNSNQWKSACQTPRFCVKFSYAIYTVDSRFINPTFRSSFIYRITKGLADGAKPLNVPLFNAQL